MSETERVLVAKRLAAAAVGGIALYVAIDVVLVFLRPGLSVLHNAESDYGSRGAWGWVMDANFLLRAALSIAVVGAVARITEAHGRLRAGLILLAVWALGSGLLAFFPDDPVGTVQRTSGRIHVGVAAVAFVAVAVGARLATRGLRGDRRWRPVVAPLMVLSYGAFVPVLLLGHAHLRPHSLGGLYEKLFLAVELSWFLTVAVWITVADLT